ncbi:MAG: glutamyl-tRNA reductase, partial [Nitrospinota bacterium]
MELVLAGVSFKKTPLGVRERLHFDERKLAEPLSSLRRAGAIQECVILSTCNRVEVYAQVPSFQRGVKDIKDFLAGHHGFPVEELEGHLYTFSTADTVRHLFRVASSLDAMVVGEPQILGQVKEAYRIAREGGYTGAILNQLFERAFSVAKKVRTETRVAESAVSVSYAAAELAKKIFGNLSGKVVLLLGAGEMAELAAQHLVAAGAETVLVANRRHERALELARALSGRAITFDRVEEELSRADIVIGSTSAPHHVITKAQAHEAIKARKGKPIFFIDIAVPRDIEPSVNELRDVYLYNIDDLEEVVEANRKQREREAAKAELIVEGEAEEFCRWLDSLNVVPTILSL